MARSATCRTCDKKIRPKAKDMSVGAAVRLHYWRLHPEVMRPDTTKRSRARGHDRS
jgi:hypothetical protein